MLGTYVFTGYIARCVIHLQENIPGPFWDTTVPPASTASIPYCRIVLEMLNPKTAGKGDSSCLNGIFVVSMSVSWMRLIKIPSTTIKH
nr:uncharacterized protein CTRU02_07049 [Colletotrichum truncatum]KAF6791865.1 hypothetical protein CTRU02_07049 [Colletotrichum truncatum]